MGSRCQENIAMSYSHTFVNFSVFQLEKTVLQFFGCNFSMLYFYRIEPLWKLQTPVPAIKSVNLPAQKKEKTLVSR